MVCACVCVCGSRMKIFQCHCSLSHSNWFTDLVLKMRITPSQMVSDYFQLVFRKYLHRVEMSFPLARTKCSFQCLTLLNFCAARNDDALGGPW